jgi:hypothetical protein
VLEHLGLMAAPVGEAYEALLHANDPSGFPTLMAAAGAA